MTVNKLGFEISTEFRVAWRYYVAYDILLGHLARNSDSTSIHYCEIWKLKKTFMLNSGNPNYFPELVAGQF